MELVLELSIFEPLPEVDEIKTYEEPRGCLELTNDGVWKDPFNTMEIICVM
jgi:hypothetical protein